MDIRQFIADTSVIRANMMRSIWLPEIVTEIFKYVIAEACVNAKTQLQTKLEDIYSDCGFIWLSCSTNFINPLNCQHDKRKYCIRNKDKIVAISYSFPVVEIDASHDLFERIANKYYRREIKIFGSTICL